jgi:hypothetical protein
MGRSGGKQERWIIVVIIRDWNIGMLNRLTEQITACSLTFHSSIIPSF